MSAGAHLAIVAGFWTAVVVALALVALIRRRRAAEQAQAAPELSATTTDARKGK
jgi:hypothetical protein